MKMAIEYLINKDEISEGTMSYLNNCGYITQILYIEESDYKKLLEEKIKIVKTYKDKLCDKEQLSLTKDKYIPMMLSEFEKITDINDYINSNNIIIDNDGQIYLEK